MDEWFDLLIIGGGINGAGIAADAARRGLSVALCEQNDLASATSSASSKLIHGGLRYLEQGDFRLVHEALKEREVLLRLAPHLIKPMAFVLPYEPHLRPAWLLRLGLFIYDHLAHRISLPASQTLNLQKTIEGIPLKKDFNKGFKYYDCFCDDARLVIANAKAAHRHGAQILTRTQCLSAQRKDNCWEIVLQNKNTKETFKNYAKAIVNASGPWVAKNLDCVFQEPHHGTINLVKGSHIVVPKIYEGNYAYIFQTEDQRVLFVIPYFEQFSLIGTTDVALDSIPQNLSISDLEIDYLCAQVNHYFKKQITKTDIVWTYAGVRPLFGLANNPSKITRDYHFELNVKNELPLLSVFGGKITTYRKLAEHALNLLKNFFPIMKKSMNEKPLPGGEWVDLAQLKKNYPNLPQALLARLMQTYGSEITKLLDGVNYVNDLGIHFGADLYQKEINYLIQHEWAQTAEDILWRRTKLGLLLNTDETEKIKTYEAFAAKN